MFSNGEKTQKEFLRTRNDRLVGYLKQIEQPDDLLKQAFWIIHTREPAAEELQALKSFLEQRGDRREQGLQQVIWAMLTSPELRFNH